VNKVFKTCRFFPPDTKVFKYLKNSEGKYNEYIMKCPPVRPKGGQIFLFKPEQPLNKITISDHYRWYSSRIKINPENQIRRQIICIWCWEKNLQHKIHQICLLFNECQNNGKTIYSCLFGKLENIQRWSTWQSEISSPKKIHN